MPPSYARMLPHSDPAARFQVFGRWGRRQRDDPTRRGRTRHADAPRYERLPHAQRAQCAWIVDAGNASSNCCPPTPASRTRHAAVAGQRPRGTIVLAGIALAGSILVGVTLDGVNLVGDTPVRHRASSRQHRSLRASSPRPVVPLTGRAPPTNMQCVHLFWPVRLSVRLSDRLSSVRPSLAFHGAVCLIFSTCARADPSLRDLTPVHGIVASISTVCTVPGLAATRAIGHRVGITKYTESNPELASCWMFIILMVSRRPTIRGPAPKGARKPKCFDLCTNL